MQIRRAVFDATQCERFNRTVSRLVPQETLNMQIMDLMIQIKRWRMTAGALAFPEKHLFPPNLAWCGLGPVQSAVTGSSFGAGGKSSMF